MKKSSNKGFTLVELIIVIAILAIIMLIAIPNFSGIQQRMQVRADKQSAAQIGKAVRIWYTEYTSDAAFKNAVGTDVADADTPVGCLPKQHATNDVPMVRIDQVAKLNEYVDTALKPHSLRSNANNVVADPQYYYVGMVGSGTAEKVVVCVSDATVPAITAVDNMPAREDDPGTADVDESKEETVFEDEYTGDYFESGKTFPDYIAYIEP